jgi:hypothetical protein
MTRSAGTWGLIRFAFPPNRWIPSRMAARSTTAGTPVKSWSTTRLGMNGKFAPAFVGLHAATAFTSSSVTYPRPAWRSAFSRRIRIEKGSRSMEAIPASSSFRMSK